jgi:hypothetical protein
LESLDAKLQKLENAWKSFVMGIANDEFVKIGVDTLTWVLETINKLTDAISGGSGLIKSIASLGVAWGGLSLGKGLVENILPHLLGGMIGYNNESGEIGKIFGKIIKDKDNKGPSVLGKFF